MDDYYKDKLEKGLEFQDFVIDLLLREVGIVISPYSSRSYQRTRGESAQGVEIKFDMRLHQTGNIYIEVAEKADPANAQWARSGIYRDDNTWLYVIGDYSTLYIFSKKWLQRVHQSGKYQEIEIKRGSSRGFLLREREQRLSMKVIETGLAPIASMVAS